MTQELEMWLKGGFFIYRSSAGLAGHLLVEGACSVTVAALVARRVAMGPARVRNTTAVLSFLAGALLLFDFGYGPICRRPLFEELILATALYLPVRESTVLKEMRYVLVAGIWFFMAHVAVQQASFFGGLGHHALLDATAAGSVLLPGALLVVARRQSGGPAGASKS